MYEPSLYKDYTKIEPLIKMVDSALAGLDWKALRKSLVSAEKDKDSTPLTWYTAWCENKDILFESNTELPHKIGDDDGSLEGAINFHVELTNTSIDRFVSIKDYAMSMYGVTYIGLHFLNPNSVVPEHTDNDSLSILYMYQVADNATLLVGKEQYTFAKGQLFAFDASNKHSAYNKTDEDWIMLAIRCNRDSFNL